MRRAWVVSMALSLVVFSSAARAEKPVCELGSEIDSIAFVVNGTCRWNVSKDVSLGPTGAAAYSFQPRFSPFFETGLFVRAQASDEAFAFSGSVGMGSAYADGSASEYLFVSATFAAKETAPYVNATMFVYPKELGVEDADNILLRYRLGLKTEFQRFTFVVGAQSFIGARLEDRMIFAPFLLVSREL